MIQDLVLSVSKFASPAQVSKVQEQIFAEWQNHEKVKVSRDPDFNYKEEEEPKQDQIIVNSQPLDKIQSYLGLKQLVNDCFITKNSTVELLDFNCKD